MPSFSGMQQTSDLPHKLCAIPASLKQSEFDFHMQQLLIETCSKLEKQLCGCSAPTDEGIQTVDSV